MTNKELKERVEKLENRIRFLEGKEIPPKGVKFVGGIKEEFKINDWIIGVEGKGISQIKHFKNNEKTLVDTNIGTTNVLYYRYATNEEIEQHLIKQAKEKGFDVGVEVKCKNYVFEGKINEFKLITDKFSARYCSPYFNEHGIHLSAKIIGWNESFDIFMPIDELKIIKEEQLTFGGKEVRFIYQKENSIPTLFIECEGAKISTDNAKKILDVFEMKFDEHGNKILTYDAHEDRIKIGCLYGTISEIKYIIEKYTREQC